MKIAFLTHSLRTGGSERQLVALASRLVERHDVTILTLRGGADVEHRLVASGVELVDLSDAGPWYWPRGLLRVLRVVRALRPHILHSYNPVPNVVAAALKASLPGVKLVWGVRSGPVDEGGSYRFSRLALALSIPFSRGAELIIANSEAGRRSHARCGYPRNRIIVIENGIDTSRYRRDEHGGRRVRSEWGVAEGAPLVGLVARLDPRKDHATFLGAAAALARRDPTIRFACVGADVGPRRATLEQLASDLGIRDRVSWIAPRDDMPAVYSALDAVCLSSSSEGFPNAVAEAMACGTPCVVTDVGDAATIVEGIGVVVPPRRADALAAGLRELLDRMCQRPHVIREAARSRISSRYSQDKLVERTEQAMRSVVNA